MFFIGVFGITQKEKDIGVCNNTICPACGALSRLEIMKTYTCFEFFFIPVFRWNTRYYAKAACCGSLFLLDPAIGQQFERGGQPEIRREHLQPSGQYLPYKICRSCGVRVDTSYPYCPHCGNRF